MILMLIVVVIISWLSPNRISLYFACLHMFQISCQEGVCMITSRKCAFLSGFQKYSVAMDISRFLNFLCNVDLVCSFTLVSYLISRSAKYLMIIPIINVL